MRRVFAGFSAFELLLTLTLIAVLASLAMASFTPMLARAKLRAEIAALFHAAHVARKESIMRHQVVSLCPSIDGRRCLPAQDWSYGWIMFNNRDDDQPPAVDAGEPVLQVHRVSPDVWLTANRRAFTFRATRKRATNGTFVVCDPQARARPRALVISYTGRPRVALEDRRGNAYRCAD